MPADTRKQRMIEALQALPDDATVDDAIERLCFIARVEAGLAQSEAGQVIPHEDIEKQFLT
jgi:predicted transcriptional regulator